MNDREWAAQDPGKRESRHQGPPMTPTEADERADFEAWRRRTAKMDPEEAVARDGLGDDADYVNRTTRAMWPSFKAGRASSPPATHLDLCASQDDTMRNHPTCDCGASSPPVPQQGADWRRVIRAQALEAFRDWQKITGAMPAGSSWIGECESLIADAVDASFAAQPSQPQPRKLSEEEILAIYEALDAFARDSDSYDLGLPWIGHEDRKEKVLAIFRSITATGNGESA